MHGDCIAELEAMVVEDPLRERRWELLMLALYHAGRQAEALRAYQRARSALIEQLGVEPGTELRALELSILQHDPSLNPSLLSRVAPGDVATWNEDVRAGDDARTRGELATAMAAYRSALATGEGAEHSLARNVKSSFGSLRSSTSPATPHIARPPPPRLASPTISMTRTSWARCSRRRTTGRGRAHSNRSRARRDVEKGGRSRNHHIDQGTYSRRPRIRAQRGSRSR